MKHATAGKVVLTAAAIGAAIMLIVSVTKDTGEVSAASGPPPAPATASPSPSSALAPSLAPQSPSTTAPPPPISAAESKELATEVGQAVHRDISSAKVGMEVYDRQSKTVLT